MRLDENIKATISFDESFDSEISMHREVNYHNDAFRLSKLVYFKYKARLLQV
jgi:hypothetical protein